MKLIPWIDNPGAEARNRAHEDANLATRLTDWIDARLPDDQVRRDYIAAQVATRLRGYRIMAMFWRVVQISSWLLVLLLGLLISVFAGLKTGHSFTIVAGAAVATLTTLTNAAHPSRLADGYDIARDALISEAWNLLTATGPYAKPELQDALAQFNHFKAEVTSIVTSKRDATKLDGLGTA